MLANKTKEYLKVTDEFHPDKCLAAKFSADMEKLAQIVNKSIEKEQNRIRLAEVEKSFVKLPADVKEMILGDHLLVKEGYLKKVCRRAVKKRHFSHFCDFSYIRKRYFWLFSDAIVYGTPLAEHAGIFTFHRSIQISKDSLKVVPLSDEGTSYMAL